MAHCDYANCIDLPSIWLECMSTTDECCIDWKHLFSCVIEQRLTLDSLFDYVYTYAFFLYTK